MLSDFLRITNETEEEFIGIAEKLFNNYVIRNHESEYRLTDIEFYWTSPRHKDECTYKRKHVNPETGEWFFHYSGVDIALRNDEIKGYGGILIRGIYDIEKGESYVGPLVCSMKLFSGMKAFSDCTSPKIITHSFPPEQIKRGERVGLGMNARSSGTDKLNYRFRIELNGK